MTVCNGETMKIGILADTHGNLPQQLFSVFSGMDHLIHAGDVGSMDVLAELTAIAPVTAVYGNCDDFSVRRHLQSTAVLELCRFHLQIYHYVDVFRECADPAHEIIIFGHTHHSEIRKSPYGLLINPGSASKPRGQANPTVAVLSLAVGKTPKVQVVTLNLNH